MIANKELTQIENARQWLKLNRGRWVDITEAVTATGVERSAVSDAIRTMRIDGYSINQEGSKRNRRYFVDNKPPSKHRISRTIGKNMVMGYIERGEWFTLEQAAGATGAIILNQQPLQGYSKLQNWTGLRLGKWLIGQ